MNYLSQLRLALQRFRLPSGLLRLSRQMSRATNPDRTVCASPTPLYNLGFAIALDKISDGVAIADERGAVCYYNAAFEAVFTHREDILIGADLAALVKGDACAEVSPVHSPDGTTSGFVATIRDTRELRRLEAELWQAQRTEAAGRLASGVAHDFNNLLTIINGYTELALISTNRSASIFAHLSEIRKAGQQAAELTRRLLPGTCDEVPHPRAVEMNELVRELIAVIQPLLGESIDIASSLDPGAGCARVDPGQLRQALLNLVMNAKDAMPEGGLLSIDTRRVPADCGDHTGYVMVSVTDTGIGMNAATKAHLFEPFYTTKAPGQGNGLGLSTAFEMARQSGGRIQVRSEPGDGAAFELYLPRCEAGDQPAASTSQDVDALSLEGLRGCETVLVLEDDASLRGLISGSLGRLGYTVLEARNISEAESTCSQHVGAIDVLLSGAPIQGIRQMRPDIRVILMSANPMSAAFNGVSDAGAGYLQKPFSPGSLARKIREILDATNAVEARPLVLVVDDEAPVRRLLADILAQAGYEVAQAGDGREAVEAVRRRAPSVVITDLVMPQQEGLETIGVIRGLAPRAKIIAISGAFGSRFFSVAMHLGANATLAKPVAGDVLLRTVHEVLLAGNLNFDRG